MDHAPRTTYHATAAAPLNPSFLPPRLREVFEDSDGEIKRLEEEAEADPSHKIDLIKHLHVGRGRADRGRSRAVKGGL